MQTNPPARFSRMLPVLMTVLLVSLYTVSPVRGLAAPAAAAGPALVAPRAPAAFPTNQIIIKYKSSSDARLHPAAASQMLRLGQVAGVALQYRRAMSGGAHVLRLPASLPLAQVQAIAARLAASPDVQYAVPDGRVFAAVDAFTRPAAQPARPALLSPTDARYSDQWNLFSTSSSLMGIDAPAAWDVTTGSSSVVVAVLDTGITAHSEFTGRTVPGYDFITDVTTANDGDGRDADPSDPGDWTVNDQCYSGSSANNSTWHGTHSAGIIGATGNNGQGVAGLNWNSKILPVRVLGVCGGVDSDTIDGLRWAAGIHVDGVPDNAHPARVLNLSLVGQEACSAAFQSGIDDVTTAGAAVVVSAGNYGADLGTYDFSPANCNGVINVAAIEPNGDLAYYSNYGSSVKISAPGGDENLGITDGILSTLNDGTTSPGTESYDYQMGTSEAAPQVSGVASLLFSLDPSLTPAKVLTILQDSAQIFPTVGTPLCTLSTCGSGILDAGAAVGYLLAHYDAGTPSVTAFSASTPSASLNIPITAFNATDDMRVTGYMITVSATPPLATDGGWTATAPTSYTVGADGVYSLHPWAKDTSGHVSAVLGAPVSVTVDTTAPTGTTITTHPANHWSTASADFSFSGSDTGSGVAGYECDLGGGFSSCSNPYHLSGLVNGSIHTLQVRAVDHAGNVDTTPDSYTWTADTTSPDTTIIGGKPSSPSASASASFSFSGSDTGSGVAGFQCQLDGGGFAACTSAATYTGLPDGTHTFQVRDVDNAGNVDPTPDSYTWIVDTIAPDTTIIGGKPSSPSASASASFSFSGSDAGSGVAGFQCQLDGGGFAACTSAATYTGMADGTHTFQVRAVDYAGNVDPTPDSYTWIVDTTAPSVSSSVLADPNPTSLSSVDFTVSFSEAVSGVDASDFGLATSGVTGAALGTVSGSGASYTVSVNTGSGNGTIRLDVLANGSIQDVVGNPLGAAFSSGQVYTVNKPITLTLPSIGAQDGWVLESSQYSSRGGSLNSKATVFRLGDDAGNRQYRAILSFNTALLPANAILQSALLKIRQSGAAVGTSPFKVLGSLWADIRKGPFGVAALQLTDFNAAASAMKVGAFNTTPASGWYTDTLSALGLGKINFRGPTQFRLYFAKGDNNNHLANYMQFVSGDGSSSLRPQLVITYTLP